MKLRLANENDKPKPVAIEPIKRASKAYELVMEACEHMPMEDHPEFLGAFFGFLIMQSYPNARIQKVEEVQEVVEKIITKAIAIGAMHAEMAVGALYPQEDK